MLAHYDLKLPLILAYDASPVRLETCWRMCIQTRQNALLPMPQRHCHERRRTMTFYDHIFGRQLILVRQQAIGNYSWALAQGPKAKAQGTKGVPTIAAARLQRRHISIPRSGKSPRKI